MPFDKPVRHMSEYLEVLVTLINEREISFAGKTLTSRGGIEVAAEPCPVLVAALGPQMLSVAGRKADGTITWMTGAKTLAGLTVPTICAAAEEAGRPPPEIVAGLPICVTGDEAGARERAASEFQIYGTLPSYRAMLDHEGLDGPADLAVIGDEAAVGEQLAAVIEAGATTIVATEFGTDDEKTATRATLQKLLSVS